MADKYNYVHSLPNVNYPYVSIVFGAGGNDPQNAFSISNERVGANGRPKYFISLTHKIITRKAAEMDITVSFVPNTSYDTVDADSFEMNVVSRMGLCTVEYGHSISDTIIFWVMLTDYSISFSNGVISYNFKGISQSVIFNSTLVNIKYPNEKHNKGIGVDDFLNYLNEVIRENTQTTLNNESRVEYELDKKACTKNFKMPYTLDDPINVSQYSLISALQKVVSELQIKGDDTDRFLTLVVDDRYSDNSTPKKIKIIECSTKSKESASLAFRWNDPDDGVLDFNVQYQGIMAMARVRATANNDKDMSNDLDKLESSLLGTDGRVSKITTYGLSDSLGNKLLLANLKQADCASARSKNYWTQLANYPYKAGLTVLGNTDPNIELASVIHIDVLLGISKHHTSGNYMVMGITDSISSRGFTTEYDLLKPYSDTDYFANKVSHGEVRIEQKSIREFHVEKT